MNSVFTGREQGIDWMEKGGGKQGLYMFKVESLGEAEKWGQEVRFLKWQEPGLEEIWKKKQFATFSNIFARKKAQRPMTH